MAAAARQFMVVLGVAVVSTYQLHQQLPGANTIHTAAEELSHSHPILPHELPVPPSASRAAATATTTTSTTKLRPKVAAAASGTSSTTTTTTTTTTGAAAVRLEDGYREEGKEVVEKKATTPTAEEEGAPELREEEKDSSLQQQQQQQQKQKQKQETIEEQLSDAKSTALKTSLMTATEKKVQEQQLTKEGDGLSSTSTTSTSNTQKRQQKAQKVVMSTFMFGKALAKSRKFRMWAETAKYNSGWDFVIVGDTKPPFVLPPNIHWYETTWTALTQRVYDVVFNGTKIHGSSHLEKASPNKKCNDFKPLFAALFPQLVEGYEWWGWMDNDVTLGNLTKFFPPELLMQSSSYDVISNNQDGSHGPFTLLHNHPRINHLYEVEGVQKESLYGSHTYMSFDQQGKKGADKSHWSESFSGILQQYASHYYIDHGYFWDKDCMYEYGVADDNNHDKTSFSQIPDRCGEVVFNKGTMTKSSNGEELWMAHWQKSNHEPPKGRHRGHDDTKFMALVDSGYFRVTFKGGYDYVLYTNSSGLPV